MENTMKASLENLEKEYLKLKEELVSLGVVLQGNIIPRIIQGYDPVHPGQKKEYGPYFQWTRKQKGKTITRNLTASQSRIYTQAIEENRKLEDTIKQMREISLKILELTTESVPKRIRK